MESKITVEDINELKFLAQQNDPSFMLKFHDHFFFFVARLHEMAEPGLNGAEMQICAYTKLHFSTKDIAMYLKCSVRSIENKKYRIRKKLKLSFDDDFSLWIARVSMMARP
jgi:DNA-binding CsgD family transcriptional regulator